MKEMDLMVLLAVFQEMLGAWLWILIGLAVAGTAALVLLLLRERTVVSRRLVQSELLGLLGGVVALVVMAVTGNPAALLTRRLRS
jgi:Trk-type K+ transport system membrane component